MRRTIASAAEKIFYTSEQAGERDIWSMDIDETDQINLTADINGHIEFFDITMDGQKIVFIADGQFKLYTMNGDGSNKLIILESVNFLGWPKLSPDAQQIVFDISYGSNNKELYVINSDGTGLTVFDNCHCQTNVWSWSTDGTKLIFTHGGGSSPPLYVANVIDGAGAATFINNADHADWHPHPTKIAFMRNRNIYTMNTNGSGEVQLTFDGLSNGNTSWSYDNTRILFDRGAYNTPFAMINADGTGFTESSVAGGQAKLVNVTPGVSCIGFESPLASGPVTVKKNRVLPLKAQLLDIDGNSVTDSDIAALPVLQVLYDSGIGGDAVDVTDDALPAGQGTEGNQFVFTDDLKWQFNLKTKNYAAAGTYNISMVSGDDSEYMIDPMCEASFVIE